MISPLEFICNIRGHKQCDHMTDQGKCIKDPTCYKTSSRLPPKYEFYDHCSKCGKPMEPS